MKFEDYRISPDIKKSIAKLGFRRPTDIQFKAIPNILKGEDYWRLPKQEQVKQPLLRYLY